MLLLLLLLLLVQCLGPFNLKSLDAHHMDKSNTKAEKAAVDGVEDADQEGGEIPVSP